MRAAARWKRLVRARLAEMEQLAPGRGAVGAGYWNAPGRARRYQVAVEGSAERDPLLSRLRRATTPRSTVIDVGAGTGRFSLALAPHVGEVVAVDPSRAMLGVLERERRRRGLENVRVVASPWQDATRSHDPAATRGAGTRHGALPPADAVLCSYVLPLIDDAEPFLARMDAACRGRAFVYMNAMSADALVDPFWRHFHGRPRRPGPTYLDAAEILGDLRLRPDVEIVEVRPLARFATLADAVRGYRDVLVLADTPEVRRELRRLLSGWLVEEQGVLRPPLRAVPAAIVSWPARGGGKA